MPASPVAPHSSTPAEIQARLKAEQRGTPLLIYRDADGRQVIVDLVEASDRVTIGRREGSDVQLNWDAKVSRLHAQLERVGEEWTLVDDGLSHNGSYIDDTRVVGRRRLRDGNVMTFGRTVVMFRDPAHRGPQPTTLDTDRPVHVELSPADRQVLAVLCRPLHDAPHMAPATNPEIADELHLSVQAVKARLHSLFGRFGLDELPQNQKRMALAAAALRAGIVSSRDA